MFSFGTGSVEDALRIIIAGPDRKYRHRCTRSGEPIRAAGSNLLDATIGVPLDLSDLSLSGHNDLLGLHRELRKCSGNFREIALRDVLGMTRLTLGRRAGRTGRPNPLEKIAQAHRYRCALTAP
jgi:hypothetical protein